MLLIMCVVTAQASHAQSDLTIGTVSRAPFSLLDEAGQHTGFSVALLNTIADALELNITYRQFDSFGDMLKAVENGETDGAIANISITADREMRMDFTQPILAGGVQVMLRASASSSGIFSVLLTRDVGLLVLAAVLLLLAGGMLMWLFERKHQPYFDHPPRDAVFPAFWWALNLVVNGGFEERMPQSRGGRVFGVLLVIGSLFIVSIFVAQITAALTVNAIQENVESLSDLDGRSVGTVEGSTTAAFLNDRGIGHDVYPNPDAMLAAFEAGDLEAVAFDGPILAYYAQTTKDADVRLLDRVYRPENYGMAFPTGSPFREQFDQEFLRLREDGTYIDLVRTWFGTSFVR